MKWIILSIVLSIIAFLFYCSFTGFLEAKERVRVNRTQQHIQYLVNTAHRQQLFSPTTPKQVVHTKEGCLTLVSHDIELPWNDQKTSAIYVYLQESSPCSRNTTMPYNLASEVNTIYEPTNGSVVNQKIATNLKLDVGTNQWIRVGH